MSARLRNETLLKLGQWAYPTQVTKELVEMALKRAGICEEHGHPIHRQLNDLEWAMLRGWIDAASTTVAWDMADDAKSVAELIADGEMKIPLLKANEDDATVDKQTM